MRIKQRGFHLAHGIALFHESKDLSKSVSSNNLISGICIPQAVHQKQIMLALLPHHGVNTMTFYTIWIGGNLERETRDLEERQKSQSASFFLRS